MYKTWIESITGKNGLTPSIGENGHWYLGDYDTGISAKGEKGDQGEPGQNGQDGKDGKDGTDGKDGKDGQDGIDGENGASVLTGKGEPSKDLCKDGDSYIDLDNWDFYTKDENGWTKQGNIKGSQGVPGQDGKDGKDGQDGTPGTDGTSLLTGNGAPTSDKGKVGDSYIDLQTWNFYVKAKEGWTFAGNIKGKDGDSSQTITPLHNGSEGLEFFPLSDGTYVQGVGHALFLDNLLFASEYNGKPVKHITGSSTLKYYGGASTQSIVVPEGVETITSEAFLYMYNLAHLELPSTLTLFDDTAFGGCTYSNLTEVSYAGTVEQFASGSIVTFNFKTVAPNLEKVVCSDGEYDVPAPVDETALKTIEVGVAYGSAIRQQIEAAIEEYETLYDGYHVNLVSCGGYDNLTSQMMMNEATGNQFDVVINYNDNLADMVNNGRIYNLSSYVSSNAEFFTNDMYSQMLESGQKFMVEGQYSLPFTVSETSLYYGESVLGVDLSGIDGSINGGQPISAQYLNSLTFDELFDKFLPALVDYNSALDENEKLFTNAPLFIDDDGIFLREYFKDNGVDIEGVDLNQGLVDMTFNNDDAKALLNKLLSYSNNGLFLTKGSSSGYGSDRLNSRNVLFCLGSSAGAAYYSFTNGPIKVAKNPADHQYFTGGYYSIIKNNSYLEEHAQQALNFYQLLMDPERFAGIAANSNYYPVTRSQKTFIENNFEKENNRLNIRDLLEAIDFTKFTSQYNYRGSSSIRNIISGILPDVLMGSKTVDKALSDAYTNAMFILN